MLGVLDQPKTLGLDLASLRPFRVRQRLEANADSFGLEIEPEDVASVIVGFERRVRTQAEKSQTPDARARALPQLR
jgi:hypothetical protein